MAGILSSFVLCPLELLKCRLQALQQTAPGGTTTRYVVSQNALLTDNILFLTAVCKFMCDDSHMYSNV